MNISTMMNFPLGVLYLTLICGCPAGGDNGNENGNDNQPDPASAEIGYTDESGLNYTVVGDGEVMPLFTSGQGGSHMFVVLHATGFPVDENGNAEINVDQLVTLGEDGRVLHDFDAQVTFSSLEDGVLTTPERIVIFDAAPDQVDGQILSIDFVLTSVADPTVTASIQQTLLMQIQ